MRLLSPTIDVHCIQHLPKKSGNMFVVDCPICRASIHPSDLEEYLHFAIDNGISGWGDQGTDLRVMVFSVQGHGRMVAVNSHSWLSLIVMYWRWNYQQFLRLIHSSIMTQYFNCL